MVKISRKALTEFLDTYCQDNVVAIATAESAYYAFNKALETDVDVYLSDEQIKYCIDKIDFSQMVTADDIFYMVARAVINEIKKELTVVKAKND